MLKRRNTKHSVYLYRKACLHGAVDTLSLPCSVINTNVTVYKVIGQEINSNSAPV